MMTFRLLTTICLSIITIVSFSDIALADDQGRAIRLKSGRIEKTNSVDLVQKSTSLLQKHVIIQFDRPLTTNDQDNLADRGIVLLDYIPDFAYTARLEKSIDQATVDAYGVSQLIRIEPEHKLERLIVEQGIQEYARRGGDLVKFTLMLHADEDVDLVAERLSADLDAQIIGTVPDHSLIELIVPEAALHSLSADDAVAWIEQADPPPSTMNDRARVSTGAAVLQEMPFGLKGSNMRIAEWDGGNVDVLHPDIGSRTFLYDESDPVSDHATHVAGTVIGNGSNSDGLYAGMAPKARMKSYLWWGGSLEMFDQYHNALNFGVSVSTNSWGIGGPDDPTVPYCDNTLGNYGLNSKNLDNMVGGSDGETITICWAAGNERDDCSQVGIVYGNILPRACAKNVIGVGAINNGSDGMTSFSSWGPTNDGRIKPDICAPGCAVTSTVPGGGYRGMCGTSMATPAAAGTILLIHEHEFKTFGSISLLPSTYKGIICNTAIDLGNPGPDYSFGWGKINGVGAVDKIGDGDPSYIESEISTGEEHFYDVTFTGEELKITLCWDDPGANPSAEISLVNDLDLVLIDPFGGEHFPWVLNPANPSADATRGVDRLNNILTVQPDNAVPGLWQARVTGYNIPFGPQKYSLVFSPDSSYLPGNTYALAVFDSGDELLQPNNQVDVQFVVANVGLSSDTVRVEITDQFGWMSSPIVDTSVFIDVYDSVFFDVSAFIPAAAFAGDHDTLFCRVTSLINPSISSIGRIVVTADAYYGLELQVLAGDTANSPETYEFDLTINNTGNDNDLFTLTVGEELGWVVEPGGKTAFISPAGSQTYPFSVAIPAEVLHETTNNILFAISSDGGAVDSATLVLSVYNPYPPPALVGPAYSTYSQDSIQTFSWEDNGDTYDLYIASDSAMNNTEFYYPGLTQASFTNPPEDPLIEGAHWWKVKRFVGADSSSLQRLPFKLVIDTQPPQPVKPYYPSEGGYVPATQFLFIMMNGASRASSSKMTVRSPEYYSLEFSQDSTFVTGASLFEDLPTKTYLNTDSLGEGRWYWRTQSFDSAGNVAPVSSPASFIMDTQSPEIPTMVSPLNGDTVATPDVILKWQLADPPAWEFAPEWGFVQVARDALFYDVIYSGHVYADTVVISADAFVYSGNHYWRVRAVDSAGHNSGYPAAPNGFNYATYLCGDVNNDAASADIVDLTYFIDYLFGTGPAPDPYAAGSVNCDEFVDIVDLTYLVEYLFGTGPEACCD